MHTFRLVNAEGKLDVREVPLEAEARACSRWCGTRRSRSTAPTPTSTAATCGTRSAPATSRSGSWACSCSTTTFADQFAFDVLDPTKIIPEEEVPVRRVGRLVLDRVVDNFFAETEQVAFCTQNVVPGIDFTNDPLLQGRNFSYLDTQLKRLGGPNFTHLPINAPKCPVAHFQQDGHMAMRQPEGPGRTTSRTPGRTRRAGRARTPVRGLHDLPRPRGRRPSAGCGPRASPTTTARRGSSTSARPRSSSATSGTRSSSS